MHFPHFEQVNSYFADFEQVKNIIIIFLTLNKCCYFADFEQVKNIIIIFLTLNKCCYFADFEQVKNIIIIWLALIKSTVILLTFKWCLFFRHFFVMKICNRTDCIYFYLCFYVFTIIAINRFAFKFYLQ